MALTKVSTDGVKDDAITSGKIPANAVGASELADNAVDTNAIANNAVTAGKTSGVQTTINNNADNRLITGSGTANTLNGQSGFTVNTSNNVLSAGGGFGIQNVSGIISGSGGGQDYISIKDSGNTERVVIKTHGTNIGKVGIGTNNPVEVLHIKEGTNKNVHFTGGIGQIGNVTGLFAVNDANTAIVDIGIAGTTVRIGTTAGERARFTGDGLCFNGDTAAANALDDYEEGEYTPTVSSGQTLHGSYDRLRYTKIGRQVTITGQLVFLTYNSSSFDTSLLIGLPFNNGDGGDRSEYIFHSGIGYFNPSGSNSPTNGYQPIGFYVPANSSTTTLISINPNADTTIGNWVGNGSDVWVNFTYFTDA